MENVQLFRVSVNFSSQITEWMHCIHSVLMYWNNCLLTVCRWTFLKAGSAVESRQHTSTKAFQLSFPVRAGFIRRGVWSYHSSHLTSSEFISNDLIFVWTECLLWSVSWSCWMLTAMLIIGVGDGGRRGQLSPKFGRKSIFGQTSCNIRAVDIFLEEGRTDTLYFLTAFFFSFHVYMEYSFEFRNPF